MLMEKKKREKRREKGDEEKKREEKKLFWVSRFVFFRGGYPTVHLVTVQKVDLYQQQQQQ